MADFKTDSGRYTPGDFLSWQENSVLEITPKFQRRAVWRPKARSYFIDTMLRGMTVPPIYLRMTQNPSRTKVIREVVDGQQRVRSVLDFIAEEFRLSPSLKAPWKGKKFSQLTPSQRDQVMEFGLPTETYKGISDQEVLELFCRLNMNGVALNKQELRNGRYFGHFKQTSYDVALKYLEFWRTHKLFTEQAIARMLEVELTSELLIAGHVGMQDKKKSIDTYYDKWEDEYPGQERDEARFDETLSTISETFSNGDLAGSAFRRPPLFYTLYCVVYHHVFGLPDMQQSSPRKRLTADQRDSLKDAVIHLSEMIELSKDPAEDISRKYAAFVLACQRQTDNIMPRKERFNKLFEEAF